jgi:hypothetical protein
MASIVVNGDTSGSVTLSAPAVAGTVTVTLPSASGTMLTTASGQWITTGSDIYYNTGNVGIGTSSPVSATKLTINGSNDQIYLRTADTNAVVMSIGNAAGNSVYFQSKSTGTGTTLPFAWYMNSTQSMTLDTSGNLGIGTTSPTRLLDVTTTGATAAIAVIQNTSTASAQLRVKNPQNESIFGVDTSTGGLTGTANATYIYTGNYPILFSPNGTERLRINASGQIGVGQNPNAYAQFQVLFDATTAANNNLGIGVSPAANTSGSVYVRFYNATGNGCGDITRVGTTNAVTYGTTSDYRLKENVQPMTGALNKVALLKPVTYIWKDCKEPAEGFIAHELQEVIPTAVSGQKDGVDEQGNPKYQNVDASYVVATLTAAIQELKAELDTVKAELAALKG